MRLVFLSGFILAFIGQTVAQELVLVAKEPLVFLGETVTLSCNGTDNSGLYVKWYRNGEFLNVTEDPGDLTYTITEFSLADVGNYLCSANVSEVITNSSEVYIAVVKPRIDIVGTSDSHRKGESYNLTCVLNKQIATSDLSYTWKRGTNTLETKVDTYVILSASSADSGTYTCTASKDSGQSDVSDGFPFNLSNGVTNLSSSMLFLAAILLFSWL